MNQPAKDSYEFSSFRCEPAERRLLRDGQPIPLTPKIFEILLALLERSGHVVSKNELMERVWPDATVEESNLTHNIYELRKALGESRHGDRYIETVPKLGYRFIAAVRELNDGCPEPAADSQSEHVNAPTPVPAAPPGDKPRRRQSGVFLALAGLIVVAALAVTLYHRFGQRAPFQTVKFARLTTNGDVWDAVISPDGKYLAYVVGNAGRQSLWVEQLATTSERQLLAPAEVRYRGLTFSPDGAYLYYARKEQEQPERVLYQLPVTGGEARKLLTGVDSAVAFAPDGRRLAFVREFETQGESVLLIANVDGTGERQLAVRKLPAFYSIEGLAWSPDGELLACPAGSFAGGFHFQVALVQVNSGNERTLGAQPWVWMKRVAWPPAGDGLFLLARDKASGFTNQVWHLSYPDGQARRITNELNDYRGLGVTANAGALVTVQSQEYANLWLVPHGETSRARQITFGANRQDGYKGLAWTPEGRIVYIALVNGVQSLWIMEADGSGQRQLTAPGEDVYSPAVSSNGRYVVFVSDRGGGSHLWRLELASRQLQELTKGELDLDPQCTPDGRWVIYSSISAGKRTLWQVGLENGKPQPLTDKLSEYPALSPDGQWLSCFYRAAQAPGKVAVLPLEGGAPLKLFDLPAFPWPLVRWHPDGQALSYVETRANISNLWRQPLRGGPATPLTDFHDGRIFAYAWSRDGRWLACARGAVNRDVVLLSEAR